MRRILFTLAFFAISQSPVRSDPAECAPSVRTESGIVLTKGRIGPDWVYREHAVRQAQFLVNGKLYLTMKDDHNALARRLWKFVSNLRSPVQVIVEQDLHPLPADFSIIGMLEFFPEVGAEITLTNPEEKGLTLSLVTADQCLLQPLIEFRDKRVRIILKAQIAT